MARAHCCTAAVSPMPNASVARCVQFGDACVHHWSQPTVCCTHAVIATTKRGMSGRREHQLKQVSPKPRLRSQHQRRICMKRHNLIRWHLIGLVPSTTSSSAANANRKQGLYRALASSDTAPAPSLSRGAQCREHSRQSDQLPMQCIGLEHAVDLPFFSVQVS